VSIDIDIDPETGLQRVPEGYFWRIVQHDDGSGALRLYHKKAWFLPARYVRGITISGDNPLDQIRSSSIYLWGDVMGAERMRESVAQLVGKYPPKKVL
jgi:hypothetical protein